MCGMQQTTTKTFESIAHNNVPAGQKCNIGSNNDTSLGHCCISDRLYVIGYNCTAGYFFYKCNQTKVSNDI